ncbi:MAG: hypothetical protein KBD78_01860 [Oligoflexales bacterium]|nr:hypothetical protein [Oligoflexales bacterium]
MKSRSQQSFGLSFIEKILLNFYSFLVAIVVQICVFSLKFKFIRSKKIKRQLQDRPLTSTEFIDKLRSNKFFDANKKLGFFFCSSAGEYEQAKPLIDRCIIAHMHCLVVFFSRSGFDFALSQNDPQKSKSEFFLLSIPDYYLHWQKILALFQVQFVCIIRHELWPGLIYAASTLSNLQIVNIEFRAISLSGFIKLILLKRAQRIYCVNEESKRMLSSYGVLIEKMKATGDTKYDRVLERAQKNNSNQIHPISAKNLTLIIGSAWPPDIEIVVTTFKEIIKQSSAIFPWQVVIAPHDISPDMIKKIERILLEHDLTYSIETELGINSNKSPITILKSMGKLAEFYAMSQISFVGGAMHHRVHNVLEPACYGNSIAFGPNYQTSPEACAMVKNCVATVINTSQELKNWWLNEHQRLLENPNQSKNQASANFVKSLAGSANLIFDDLLTHINAR